jgi:hypothetical protein
MAKTRGPQTFPARTNPVELAPGPVVGRGIDPALPSAPPR